MCSDRLLCPSTPSGNTTVTSDPAGNSTGTSSAPIANNNRDQVTTIGGTAMTYRDLGNDLRATTGSTRVISGPLGITATVTNGVPTFYTRDTRGTVLNSHDGTTTANYVTEFNGSVAAIFTPAGAAIGSYAYTPYGETTVANETGTTQAAANRFRYIGGYQDLTGTGADGFYKLGARYYDARGHFTQPDAIAGSITNPKTMTAYNYAGGDPINQADSSGYAFFDVGGLAKGALDFLGKGLLIGTGLNLILSDPSGREVLNFFAAEAAGILVGAACEGAVVFATGGIGALATGGCFALGAATSATVSESLDD